MIAMGTKVFLKVYPYGEPGTVVRIERARAVVRWHDLDYLTRHRPDGLIETETQRPTNRRSDNGTSDTGHIHSQQ